MLVGDMEDRMAMLTRQLASVVEAANWDVAADIQEEVAELKEAVKKAAEILDVKIEGEREEATSMRDALAAQVESTQARLVTLGAALDQHVAAAEYRRAAEAQRQLADLKAALAVARRDLGAWTLRAAHYEASAAAGREGEVSGPTRSGGGGGGGSGEVSVEYASRYIHLCCKDKNAMMTKAIVASLISVSPTMLLALDHDLGIPALQDELAVFSASRSNEIVREWLLAHKVAVIDNWYVEG